eukprot:COSAG02_NODE_87_length_38906_cov_69.688697_10_plen_56_part_00
MMADSDCASAVAATIRKVVDTVVWVHSHWEFLLHRSLHIGLSDYVSGFILARPKA